MLKEIAFYNFENNLYSIIVSMLSHSGLFKNVPVKISNLKNSLLWIPSAVILILCSLQIDGAFDDANNNIVKMDEHSLELTQTMNLQRQEYLQKQCDSSIATAFDFNNLTEIQMEHMIIDKNHKLLYCYVPKVACTNWKRVLMVLNGNWSNITDPLQIPGSLAHSSGIFVKLNALNKEEKQQVATEYTRLIFVRHPFERLLSAYRNKLEGSTASARYFQKRIGRQIIKNFRLNPSSQSLARGDDVTFAEFIQYIITPELSLNNSSSYNEHWEPITKLCNPCIMKYNVIGKYETLLDDSALALHLMNSGNITFPTGHKPSNTRSYLHEYFDALHINTIQRLYAIYADDFRLFDYDLGSVLGYELG